MRTEAMHPLRAAAEEISPKIRRDREDGLYVLYGPAAQHAYFEQLQRGEWTVLVPSSDGIAALEAFLCTPQPFGFDQFSGRKPDAEGMRLLCQGIKLLEAESASAEALLYERAIRRRAAQLLRKHDKANGGTLPLCMRIAETIQRNRKETPK